MENYYFFFSYATENRETAKGRHYAAVRYYLDEFFEDLCNHVSEKTGKNAQEVAYRDRERLRVADFWNEQLVDGLQRSPHSIGFSGRLLDFGC
jgi:hypothetical protein